MSSIFKLPLEQKSREEAEEKRIIWNTGAFNFLLTRTQEKYRLKEIAVRRQKLETKLNNKFLEINDDMLRELYQFACTQYMQRCQRDYSVSSGFGKTPSENVFARTISKIIRTHPKLKHLEIYPSHDQSKDLPPNFKMVVGNYVPDFVVFGLKTQFTSGVAIEIDGDSHISKSEKDQLRRAHLNEQKLFTWEIQNSQTADFQFITAALLQMYRLRNGSFNRQILRAKRSIRVKTISCQLSIEDIEEFVLNRFSVQLKLKAEAKGLLELANCPRKIKRELSKILPGC